MNAQDLEWNDLYIVLAVCRQGTLSGAARVLEVSHSTVLRRIDSVEKKLGVRLFDRLAMGYVMTEAGELMLETGERVENEMLGLSRTLIGHVLHLLEDMHSPAHVRNGSHPGGDYLEIFGRHTGGFFLKNGKFSAYDNNVEITKAVEDIDVNDIMLNKNPYNSYESFMAGEALWVSENFFSEAHGVIPSLFEDHIYTSTDSSNPPGVNLDGCGIKNTTIFDIETRNPSLAESDTILSIKSFLRTGYDSILTNGNASSQINGDISNETVVAFEEREESFLFGSKCRSMAAPYKYTDAPGYYDYNKRALIDTAKHVIPRAVASVQAFTNYFFRGRMEAHLSFDNEYIIVQNTSVPDWVGDSSFLTFRADVDPFINIFNF